MYPHNYDSWMHTLYVLENYLLAHIAKLLNVSYDSKWKCLAALAVELWKCLREWDAD